MEMSTDEVPRIEAHARRIPILGERRNVFILYWSIWHLCSDLWFLVIDLTYIDKSVRTILLSAERC